MNERPKNESKCDHVIVLGQNRGPYDLVKQIFYNCVKINKNKKYINLKRTICEEI
jgi:hypothetical protein